MRFRSHTMWMILMAMFAAATLATGNQQTFSFSTPEVIDSQIEKDSGLAMDYAVSLPGFQLPGCFYSYEIVGQTFTICLKTLRIRLANIVLSFPTGLFHNVIAINGP